MNYPTFSRLTILGCLASLLVLAFSPLAMPAQIPVTGLPAAVFTNTQARPLPGLQEFLPQVNNGRASQVTGIYAPGVLALPVIQQPAGNPGFVSTQPGLLTQFGMASQYGSIGILAHNYLEGEAFFAINEGGLVIVIYGDSNFQYYKVEQIRRFKATMPTSPYSNFIDLEDGRTLTATQLFMQTSGLREALILQTCIEAEGNDSWGRLFIIARPVTLEEVFSIEIEPELVALW
jgi:hypothetical protein